MKTGFTSDPKLASAKLGLYSKPAMGVEVGVLPNAQDYPANIDGAGGETVADIASYHELNAQGAYHKWLLKAITISETEQTREMIEVLKKSGPDANKRKHLMAELGDMIAENVQKNILAGKVDIGPNAAETLSRKQGSVPMVDSKHLISVIDSKVVIGG